ncbi:MAG: hypothetical protein H6Q76_1028 [Firmicutes bacterium]|nr:hypothetical protein [Bacillota bacterium]
MKKMFMFMALPMFDGETTAAAAPVATENTAVETAASTAETTVVDGVVLTELTPDQLGDLSKEEFEEFYAVVKKYIEMKSAEEWSEKKAKFAPYWDKWTTYVTGPGKWVAIAVIGAKVFGWI